MFKLLGSVLKTGFFALGILVLGHLLRWDGETLSDQVKAGISRADPGPLIDRFSSWVRSLVGDARAGGRRARPSAGTRAVSEDRAISSAASAEPVGESELTDSERQKLRALIHELNQARGR